MNLKDYICVIDNSLDQQTCEQLIFMFNSPLIDQYKERYENNHKPNFTQFNFTRYKNLNINLHNICEQAILNAVKTYNSTVPDAQWLPKRYGFESFRIKHYDHTKNDMFDTHIDSEDIASSKRFLIMFWYLNEVNDGGETFFNNLNYSVKPQVGKLVMFPPFWMYPHTGKKPISNSKYILSSQLNYIE